MVVSSHQSEKLSQLQTMLEAGRAGPLPVADRLELRRLVDALCHASKATVEPLLTKLEEVPVATPRLHPNLPAIYQGKITSLKDALNTPDTITQANEAIRQLIEKVRLVPEGKTLNIELFGELAALLSLGIGPNDKHPLADAEGVQVTLVAGAGFEPATFRL